MQHAPTHLERIIRSNEEAWDEDAILADINASMGAEEERSHIENTIMRRVHAMMKYVLGVCQKEPSKRATAEKATAALERIVVKETSEIRDPELLMEEIAVDEVFEPRVSEALISMEEALHEAKDWTKPAANKPTLRSLLQRRKELGREAA